MGLFAKADPRAKLESQLQAKRAQLDGNAKRLQDAENRLTEARRKVDESALGDDAKALDSALANRRSVEDLVGALSAASGKISQEITGIETQIEQERDKIMRNETAEAIKDVAARLDDAMDGFDSAASALEACLRESAVIVLEAHGPVAYVMNARTELVPALTNVLEALRQHCAGVLNGHYAASLPQAAPEPPKLAVVAPPPMLTVLAMQHLKYIGEDGAIACCGKYRKHILPKKLAELAVSSHLALELSDKRVRDLEGTAGMYVPSEESCTWLGPVGKEAAPKFMRPGPAPTYHSSSPTAFTPMDRGPAFSVTIPRQEPVPMGARNAPEEESQR
jgi:hypothetical protein